MIFSKISVVLLDPDLEDTTARAEWSVSEPDKITILFNQDPTDDDLRKALSRVASRSEFEPIAGAEVIFMSDDHEWTYTLEGAA